MKRIMMFMIGFFLSFMLFSQMPEITPQSFFFSRGESGYDLYIKKLAGVESIILTESQRDPAFKVTAYSLRSIILHPTNANEKRVLDGREITIKDSTCYLIDSTAETVAVQGDYFHFFLTDEVVYGYSWTRNGKMKIEPGVRINVRQFEKKYGDYSGKYGDQWLVLDIRPIPEIKVEKSDTGTALARSEGTIVLLHVSETEEEKKPETKPPETVTDVSPPVEATSTAPTIEEKPPGETSSTGDTTSAAVTAEELPPTAATITEEKQPAETKIAPDSAKDKTTAASDTTTTTDDKTTSPKDLDATKESEPAATPPADKEIQPSIKDLTALVEKIALDAEKKTHIISSIIPVLIDKNGQFPYKNLPGDTYIEEVFLKAGADKIIIKTLYEIDKERNKTRIGYSTYHYDDRGRLIIITEYSNQNTLESVYKIEYDSAGNHIKISHYDKDGKLIESK